VVWEAPEPRKRRQTGERSGLAVGAVALGVAAGAAAVVFDALYISVHLDDPSRYDAFALVPNVLLVPASAILLAIGGRALVAERRQKLIIVVLAVAWALAVWFAPEILAGPVQPVL